jgi:hypothetical protein
MSPPSAGRRPVSSTCTLCANPGAAVVIPRCSTRVNFSSAATSRSTSTARAGMPPKPSSANGSGASRVQITTPSGAGSPDATPRVNGSFGTGLRRRSAVNPATGSAARTTAPLRTARRLDTDTAKCQRAIFRAGDEQPYGVPPQRCRYRNTLCTLPFPVMDWRCCFDCFDCTWPGVEWNREDRPSAARPRGRGTGTT